MEINKTVRKANYDRGMRHGANVYCGQDLRDFIGMSIRDVTSDDIDSNVIMWLEDEERSVGIYFDDLCFDGEHIKTVNHSGGASQSWLRDATEADLKQIREMEGYYDTDVYDCADFDKKIGVNHMYCNDINLEGSDDFTVKSLYVFLDGRIMTEKEL